MTIDGGDPVGSAEESAAGSSLMWRSVNQLLFSYLPGRTVDWEDGLAIVQLTAVKLDSVWESARSKLVLDEVSRSLDSWRLRKGEVDEKFPDPKRDPARLVIGEPCGVSAQLMPSALVCQSCGRLAFRKLAELAKSGKAARVCPSCHKTKLRQFGQVLVHGCGELVPIGEWLPIAKPSNDGLQPGFQPLWCSTCGRDAGEPSVPKGVERISDMRIVCLKCRGIIVQRLTGRCHRCTKKLGPTSRPSDDDKAKDHIIPRLAMRATNYQASEAYYPQSISLLRLGRPKTITAPSAIADELRALLPDERRPSEATLGDRLVVISTQIAAAEQLHDDAEVARLRALLVAAATQTMQSEASGTQTALEAAPDVYQGIEETLALLTEVRTEGIASLLARSVPDAAQRNALLGERLEQLGLVELRHVQDLPIIKATFGYTRRSFEPTYEEIGVPDIPTTIRPFFSLDRHAAQRLARPDLEGTTPILAREGEHEGILFVLDPGRVSSWLGVDAGKVQARALLLGKLEPVDRYYDEIWKLPHRRRLFGLLHTFAHAVMRVVGRLAGLERTSLAEHIFLPLPGFVVYAADGTFNLGTMEVVLRDHAATLLEDVAGDEGVGCLHDPDCLAKLGACIGCVHAPEITCRFFNHGLSRSFLIGGHEPWSDVASRRSVDGYWVTNAPKH